MNTPTERTLSMDAHAAIVLPMPISMSRKTSRVAELFEDRRLSASQYRTIALRRYGDAVALQQTRDNERAAGAMYLAGFVVECLLKSELIRANPWVQGFRSTELLKTEEEKATWKLCYRSHELNQMLDRIQRMKVRARKTNVMRERVDIVLKQVCGMWTVYARYSPTRVTTRDADAFLGQVEEIKKWLDL